MSGSWRWALKHPEAHRGRNGTAWRSPSLWRKPEYRTEPMVAAGNGPSMTTSWIVAEARDRGVARALKFSQWLEQCTKIGRDYGGGGRGRAITSADGHLSGCCRG